MQVSPYQQERRNGAIYCPLTRPHPSIQRSDPRLRGPSDVGIMPHVPLRTPALRRHHLRSCCTLAAFVTPASHEDMCARDIPMGMTWLVLLGSNTATSRWPDFSHRRGHCSTRAAALCCLDWRRRSASPGQARRRALCLGKCAGGGVLHVQHQPRPLGRITYIFSDPSLPVVQ